MSKTTSRLVVALVLFCTGAMAQMPHDAIYMSKGQVCVAAMYGRSSWDHYWEGTLKRQNFNLGTHTTQSAMLMPAIGATKNLNVILSLPYVWTKTSAGNLMGQRGLQDLAVWAKYRAFSTGGFSAHAIAGASVPLGNYVPDFLPMSIGLQCRTVTGRALLNYRHPATGLYVTGHGSYIWRSNIRVDRDSYQAHNRLYNTNEVSVPNAFDWAGRLGVLRSKWQTEVLVERNACVNGDDIRRNDMPFPTNNMQATVVGWYGKVQPKNIGLNARVGHVVDGLNAGQSTSYMVGVLYQFNVN